jgi:hypothetical protein
MKIAVGTAHLTVVNIPEKGVERRSNQGKSGKNDACLHPRSSKIFVYQPISTKFNKKVAVGTSHIRKGRSTQEKGPTREQLAKK